MSSLSPAPGASGEDAAAESRAAEQRSSGLAYLLLAITTLAWAGNAVASRLAVGEVSPMALTGLRWSVVMLAFVLVGLPNFVRHWRVLRARWRFCLAMGALGYTAFNALMYVAAHHTTAVNMAILQGAMPAMVFLGTLMLYGTRASRLQVVGVGITLVGVGVVATRGEFATLRTLSFNIGDLLMLVACISYAGYTILLRNRPAVPGLTFFFFTAFGAVLASVPLVVGEVASGTFQWPTPFGWALVLYVGTGPSLIAQSFFMRGRRIDRTQPGGPVRQSGAGVRPAALGSNPGRDLRRVSRCRTGAGVGRHIAGRTPHLAVVFAAAFSDAAFARSEILIAGNVCRRQKKCPAYRRAFFGEPWRRPAFSGTLAGNGSDRFLEFLGGAERDLLAGLDLDRLAGGRVAAHAGGALADLQDAEAADADAVALLEVTHQQADHVAQDAFRRLLGHLVVLGELGRDVLERDRRLRCCLRCRLGCCGHFRSCSSGVERLSVDCNAFWTAAVQTHTQPSPGFQSGMQAGNGFPLIPHRALISE